MDNLIYSVSPLRAFSGAIIGVVILFLLGLGTPFLVMMDRKESIFKKIIVLILGTIILFTGWFVAAGAYRQYQGGAKTTFVQVLEKRESTGWCNRELCTDYVAETTNGEKLYVFGLKKKVWNVIEVNSCYQFTYYPAEIKMQGESRYPSLYEPTGEIVQIEKVNCP